MDLFLSTFAALISVLNPLGTVPVFVALTSDDDALYRKRTSIWTSINVFIILVISFFIGKSLLQFFGISLDSLRIAGGMVIVSSGFALLTGSFSKHKGMKKSSVKRDAITRSEIALTPLAIPMLAGPGSISYLINLHYKYNVLIDVLLILTAVLAICLVIFLLLRYSFSIVKLLGASGINAISRIIGFIVISIGVEMVSTSIFNLIDMYLTLKH